MSLTNIIPTYHNMNFVTHWNVTTESELSHIIHNSEDTQLKILLLGTNSSGKSTIFKQIKDINPSEYGIDKQRSEKESAKEEAKNVIRMNLIAEMATLISRGVTYHHDHPTDYMEPTYPEEYEIKDPDAPNGRYIVNIKEAAETIVNLSKDAFSDVTTAENPIDVQESDEYWIVLGVYIEALWEQQWIKDMYYRKNGLFSLSDNIAYFLDKARACMAPWFRVSDEVVYSIRILYIHFRLIDIVSNNLYIVILVQCYDEIIARLRLL